MSCDMRFCDFGAQDNWKICGRERIQNIFFIQQLLLKFISFSEIPTQHATAEPSTGQLHVIKSNMYTQSTSPGKIELKNCYYAY